MDGLQRRPSGIFVVRLVVPQRLRHIVGKTELVASTGVREPALARVVGAELLAQWRRRLLDLDRLTNNMDLVQVTLGSPVLQEAGFLSLNDAERASGIEAEGLLRKAAEMRLALFYRAINLSGHLVPKNALEEEPDGGVIFPMPNQMPPVAEETRFSGVLRVAKIDTYAVASALLVGDSPEVVAFDVLELPDLFFVPAEVVQLGAALIELSTVQVEKLRVTLAANVSPPQLAEARAAKTAVHTLHSTKASKRVSDAVVAFIKDETTETLSEQRDRIRQDLMLFGDLLGDPQVGQVDRDMLRKYRDDFLPKVPANAHRVLPERPDASMKEKIAAVASSDWPRLSNLGISRRMAVLGRLFTWLVEEGWISINPAKNLASKGAVVDVNYPDRSATTMLAGGSGE